MTQQTKPDIMTRIAAFLHENAPFAEVIVTVRGRDDMMRTVQFPGQQRSTLNPNAEPFVPGRLTVTFDDIPTKIKQPRSAYILWTMERKHDFDDELSWSDRSKIMGHEWSDLMTEEDKAPWREAQRQDQERYWREKSEAEQTTTSEDDLSEDEARPIKRPRSAYILWSTQRRVDSGGDLSQLSFGEQAKLLGREWREMTDANKEMWAERQREDQERYWREKGGDDMDDGN